jgi:lysophospholipase L1-like esterase
MNIILGLYAIRFYRQLHRILLDPVNAGAFGDQDMILNTDGKPLVVLLGDSRISHWQPLPSLAGCRIVNRGVSNETTPQTLLRFEKDIISLKPSLAVIQVGINDLKTIGVFPKQSQHIIDSCERNIKTMVERLTANDICVIVMTLVPPAKPELLRRPVWSNEIYSAVHNVNDAIRAIESDKVVVLDCNAFMTDGKRIKSQYSCDTLHLSRSGYEKLNEHLEPVMIELIESLNN